MIYDSHSMLYYLQANAVPGVSLGQGLLIPDGYLHPGESEHSEV